MCCLNYEQEHYCQTRRRMPRVGSTVQSPDGEGVVLDNNAITETVRIKITLPDESIDIKTFKLEEIRFKGQAVQKSRKTILCLMTR